MQSVLVPVLPVEYLVLFWEPKTFVLLLLEEGLEGLDPSYPFIAMVSPSLRGRHFGLVLELSGNFHLIYGKPFGYPPFRGEGPLFGLKQVSGLWSQ